MPEASLVEAVIRRSRDANEAGVEIHNEDACRRPSRPNDAVGRSFARREEPAIRSPSSALLAETHPDTARRAGANYGVAVVTG